ncbi:hypothetical protein QUB70_29330 [Microcoleus sp. A003_D6]
MHHSQLLAWEQAFRPLPQEINFIVEQAGKPVLDNGARCELDWTCAVPLDLPSLQQQKRLFHPSLVFVSGFVLTLGTDRDREGNGATNIRNERLRIVTGFIGKYYTCLGQPCCKV